MRPTLVHLPSWAEWALSLQKLREGEYLSNWATLFAKSWIMIGCSLFLWKSGWGWSYDSILANEMEREVCWGFLENILTPEMKKVKTRKFIVLLPPSFPSSFLSSSECFCVRMSCLVGRAAILSFRGSVSLTRWGWQSRRERTWVLDDTVESLNQPYLQTASIEELPPNS